MTGDRGLGGGCSGAGGGALVWSHARVSQHDVRSYLASEVSPLPRHSALRCSPAAVTHN